MSYYVKTPIAKEIEQQYRKLYPLVTGVQKPEPQPEDLGYIKPGGWGGDMENPSKWKVVKMKDDPRLWKVVDKKGKNIAANFLTKEGAQKFIDKATGGTPTPPPVEPVPKDEGYTKPGGWGGDTKNPKKWKVVSMKDDPKLFKVVDAKGKNIATNFTTKAGAQAFIEVAVKLSQEDGEPDPDTPEVPPTTPTEPPTTPPPQGTFTGPYAGIGPILQSSTRGPTERHYRSGKEDDWTIEKNVHNIKAKNHQFVSYVTMHKIEHDDTISHKGGGRHMEEGWFDHTVSFEKGETGLGTERKHPDYDLIKNGPSIGSVLGKKIGVATAYFTEDNHSELWVDFPANGKWKKVLEETNLDGFDPGANTFEAQLRIDGFFDEDKNVPTIHSSTVQEIAPKNK